LKGETMSIIETISTNPKREELKELFSRLSYEELQTLKFVTESVKKDKPKRKYTKKKKDAEKPQEEPQIETVEGVNLDEIKVEENKD
jgi:hypothetical protein